MSKGVMIVAAGHWFYGRCAFQLAVSLKNNNPAIEIALAYTDSAIESMISRSNDDLPKFIDHFVQIPDDYLLRNGATAYFRVKCCLPLLTPFDETIYLDADILWNPNKKIDDLFDELKDVEFTMQSRGRMQFSEEVSAKWFIWADVNLIKQAYRFTDQFFYNISSEFIYFKKTPAVKKLFSTAVKEFDNAKVESRVMFGNSIPDELAFGISMAKNKLYPHKENFVPVYWENMERQKMYLRPKDLYDNYFATSFGGNIQIPNVKELYNNLIKFYFRKSGMLRTPMEMQDKCKLINERINY